MKNWLVSILVVSVFALPSCTKGWQGRTESSFDSDWKFKTESDTVWHLVNLPHDFALDDRPGTQSPFDSTVADGIASGFISGGRGTYSKQFFVPKSREGGRTFIFFDGVYMNSAVFVNGSEVVSHIYGYTPFQCDISDYLRYGEDNSIEVTVDSRRVTSRWYSGAGIFRPVKIVSTGGLYEQPFSSRISTLNADDETASLAVSGIVVNKTSRDKAATYKVTIFDGEGRSVASTERNFTISPGDSLQLSAGISLPAPHLWSDGSPYLYTARTDIVSGRSRDYTDSYTFGIRTIKFDPKRGMLLNGVPTVLRGGCVHHDNGPLGAEAFDRSEARKVRRLKDAGFNAIRTSHNPPSSALLNACDSIGMLVIEEAFDVWRYGHFEGDYSASFDAQWRNDLSAMVSRDINHPSVIMWSSGNEIIKDDTPETAALSYDLSAYLHLLDPSRAVTSAVNGIDMTKGALLSTLDVPGFNYSRAAYNDERFRGIDGVVYGSESYPSKALDYWRDVEKYPWVIGDFVWTAWDYIGESGIGWYGYDLRQDFYPFHLAYCGDFDILGERRPQSYYRQAMWSEEPMVYIAVRQRIPSFPLNREKKKWSVWDWPDDLHLWNYPGQEGKEFDVYAYTNCSEVELFVDGKSLGKHRVSAKDEIKSCWKVPYCPGTLKVVGSKGKLAAADSIVTEGPVAALRLLPENLSMKAGGDDVCYVDVELVDSLGRRNNLASDEVTFSVSGPAEIASVANGNPMSTESFRTDNRRAWRGKCQVILRSEAEAGEVRLTVRSGRFEQAVDITVE